MTSGAEAGRVVYLHIGAPKTGTTYLQDVLDRNRQALAGAGVLYAPAEPGEQFRAAVDLRGLEWGGDPHPEWSGSWMRLAQRAVEWPGTSLISNELLAGASAEQARHATESLGDADVHVILTLRDLSRMLRSDWQEQVKHRHAVTWEAYLRDVVDGGTSTELGAWFWELHDGPAVLARWRDAVPADRIHVVCLPAAPAQADHLWRQFAAVIGVQPHAYDVDVKTANVSLGAVETEFLQRVNKKTSGVVDKHRYADLVGSLLIRDALSGRPVAGPVRFPAQRMDWLTRRSDQMVADLAGSGYDVVGDLVDLTCFPAVADDPDGEVPVAVALDLGADVAARLLRRIEELHGEAGRLRDEVDEQRERIHHLTPPPRPSPADRLKQRLSSASERHRSVMVLRRIWWRTHSVRAGFRADSRADSRD